MSQNPSFGKLSLASVLAHKHANLAPVSPRTPCVDCETHFLASDLVCGQCPECFREDVEEQVRRQAADKASAALVGVMHAILCESVERPGRLCVLGVGKTSTEAWGDAGEHTIGAIRRARSVGRQWCARFEASEWDANHNRPAGAEYAEYDD